jgi:uroporphyrin-III C-methyltransferase
MIVREKVVSPAIIVVGEVVELSDADNRLKGYAALAERRAELTEDDA